MANTSPRALALAALAIAVAGLGAVAVVSSRGGKAATSHAVSLPPTLEPTDAHSVQALMVGLVDPAADGIWNSVGSVATASSDETWEPLSDEDWRRLEGHARALGRAADALAQPSRVNGRANWAAPVRALRTASEVALSAAQRRNIAGIYAASEGLLDACQQCHAHYWLPTEGAR